MGIFKAVGGALNQLSEFLTTAERNKQIKEGVANGELMEVHQASFIIQVKEMLISDSLTCTRCNGLCIPVLETSNKYVCLKCEYRFSNSKHKFYYVTHEKFYDPKIDLSVRPMNPHNRFIDVTAKDYDKAVAKLKEETNS